LGKIRIVVILLWEILICGYIYFEYVTTVTSLWAKTPKKAVWRSAFC